jgi:periplasmic nitrate reductase NapD
MHISSLIVHARPGADAQFRAGLTALDGVELHAVADDGRMIVTMESADDAAIRSTYEAIERLDGVLSVAMVYHQVESDPDKEI